MYEEKRALCQMVLVTLLKSSTI